MQREEAVKRNAIFFRLAIFIYVLVFLSIGGALVKFVNVHLQPLSLPVTASLPTAVAAKSSVASASQAGTVVPVSAPSESCGSGTMLLLFNGTGTANGMISADAIRLLKVDFTNNRVAAIAFPRDLRVRTKWLEPLGITDSILGQAFHYEHQATQGDPKKKSAAGTRVIAQTLYDNFDVVPQHYITVSLATWRDMIDTVGGVEVTLLEPFTMVDGTVIPVGRQKLTGQMASDYIRINSAGEPDRLQRQNRFIYAIKDQVELSRILPKVPELLAQFKEGVVTDLTTQQLMSLRCLAGKIPADQITFYAIGSDMVTEGPGGELIPNTGKIKAFLSEALSR